MTREELKAQIRSALDEELQDARSCYKTHEAFLISAVRRAFDVIVDALFEEGEQA